MKNIQKQKIDKNKKEEKDNYFKFVTTLAILLLIFVITYFLIGLFYTKEINFNKKEDESAEISVDNTTIMIGQLFDQVQSEYYVLIYDVSDKDSSIASWLSVYKNKDNALSVYTVDSTKKFNSKYITNDNSNKNASDLSNLKVKSPTLIKISNKSISEYIEGEEDIINIFKSN